MFFLGIFGQNLDFRSPETQAVIPTKRELMKPLPDRFRDENVFFSSKALPKHEWKLDFSPPNIKNQPLTTLWIDRSWNFASIGGMDTSVRPNLTDLVAKTCKKSVKMKVSNSSRQFPRVYRGFPTLSNPSRGSSMMSEGSQPVAPTLHVKKKLITECREKSDHRVPRKKCMSRKKRIHVKKKVITAWREKLMTNECWLLIDHWSLMIDD